MEVVGGWRIVREVSPSGLRFATSPDYRGLLVAAQSDEELTALIPEAVAELQEAIQQRGAA